MAQKGVEKMSVKKAVICEVKGFRSAFEPQTISFRTGKDLSLVLTGQLGPNGLSKTAADLIDFASAVYQIERLIRMGRTTPPRLFELTMPLRVPDAWGKETIKTAKEILLLLGNAEWSLEFHPGLRAAVPEFQSNDERLVNQVVLFSGGMDSTCGLASIQEEVAWTQLVSFYTRQKTQQIEIASNLGFGAPLQWRMDWNTEAGQKRGRTFYYRSFLFLSLAAAVAESWGARKILQFENGILASSIPPSPAWMMTKHSHPQLHKLASKYFSTLFGEEWKVENPFLHRTKRQCFDEAAKSIGEKKARAIIKKTDTCWFQWSNHVFGYAKKPGLACGVCIPCIIRRTALMDKAYKWDLRKDSKRNNPKLGVAFRSYFLFTEKIAKTRNSPSKFYGELPALGRNLVFPGNHISLKDLHALFLRFSDEFMETYQK